MASTTTLACGGEDWQTLSCTGRTPLGCVHVKIPGIPRADPEKVDTHGLTPVALAKEVFIYIEDCMPSNSLYGWHSPTLLRAWSSAMV